MDHTNAAHTCKQPPRTHSSPEDPQCRVDLERAVIRVVAKQLASASSSGSDGEGKANGEEGEEPQSSVFPVGKVFPRVWAAYLALWVSHEALELTRVICVHNRLTGGECGDGWCVFVRSDHARCGVTFLSPRASTAATETPTTGKGTRRKLWRNQNGAADSAAAAVAVRL